MKYKKRKIRFTNGLNEYIESNNTLPGIGTEYIENEIGLINKNIEKYEKDPRDPFNWKNFQLPPTESEADELLEFLCFCLYKQDEIDSLNRGKGPLKRNDTDYNFTDNSNRKNLLLSQRHRIAVRKEAKKIWEKDPTITIADMIYRDEIDIVCEGKSWSDKTLRKWIKDLCPNRSPGRRPKKSS